MEQIAPFHIIGTSVKTTNENAKANQDIGTLWDNFIAGGISDKIPDKESDDVYVVYTDYESNYQGKYTVIIGHQVPSLDKLPEGIVGRHVEGGTYRKFTAKGEMPQALMATWKEIWEQDKSLNRSYTADFEVYDERFNREADAEVDIYVAVK